MMQHVLDDGTDPWGVQVERVEIKDVRLPVHLQRAMATEAEAQREARAQVIASEGEKKASHALKEAADVINQSANALQLRYLQTMSQIAAEKNSTIIFPLPVDLLMTSQQSGGTSDVTVCKSRGAEEAYEQQQQQQHHHHHHHQQQQQQQQHCSSAGIDNVAYTLPPPPYR